MHYVTKTESRVFKPADITGEDRPQPGPARWQPDNGSAYRYWGGKRAGKGEELTADDELWCELVLNGIGGRTIAEAQERISFTEFHKWLAYRQKRGSFHMGMRMERAGALIASFLANQVRDKNSPPVSFYDFAPYHDEPVISMEQAMENWT